MKFRLLNRKIVLWFPQFRYKSNCFITTPIYYVNASPHIGHLYTSLLADAHHRFQLLLGHGEGIFSTGTDEHGTKVQQAAAAMGTSLPAYCDKIAGEYKLLFDDFGIGYNRFLRTTSEIHKEKVQWFWKELEKRGHIQKGTYSGWYCDADEAFLTQTQVVYVKDKSGKEIPTSPESGRPVHWLEEVNYKFDLPKFKEQVKKWVNSDRVIQPKKFKDLCNLWIDEGVMDKPLSVSRPEKRVHWSIKVPGDNEQTIYVWLDALVNYLTVADRQWPPKHQIIGKDILKFHGIYWPAFLFAADMEPPKSLLVHSHWTVDGDKMSKSKGNVINPTKAAETFGVSGLRYFLLREGTPHSDSNYSETKILRVLNSELADTLGNLLSRSTGAAVNKKQIFPQFDRDDYKKYCKQTAKELTAAVEELPDVVKSHFEEFNFYKGISAVMNTLHAANRFVEESRPWELRKIATEAQHLDCVLHLTLETLRICGIALIPIVPEFSGKILDKLKIPSDKRTWNEMLPTWNEKIQLDCNKLASEKIVLYRRIQAK